MSRTVRVIPGPSKAKIKSGKFFDDGLLEMANDIHRRAIINAPVLTSALRNSGKVSKVSKGYSISFGNSRVPYAVRRHFENKKNPQTKLYLFKAADSVMRGNLSKYFRGKI